MPIYYHRIDNRMNQTGENKLPLLPIGILGLIIFSKFLKDFDLEDISFFPKNLTPLKNSPTSTPSASQLQEDADDDDLDSVRPITEDERQIERLLRYFQYNF